MVVELCDFTQIKRDNWYNDFQISAVAYLHNRWLNVFYVRKEKETAGGRKREKEREKRRYRWPSVSFCIAWFWLFLVCGFLVGVVDFFSSFFFLTQICDTCVPFVINIVIAVVAFSINGVWLCSLCYFTPFFHSVIKSLEKTYTQFSLLFLSFSTYLTAGKYD